MKMNVIIGVLFLTVFGVAIAMYMYQKPADTLVSGDAVYTVDAPELFKVFTEDETAANQKYFNKVITVKGKIIDITATDSLGTNVVLDSGSPAFGVSCQFPVSMDELSLKVGDEVQIKGLCSGMLMDVVLIRCKIDKK